MQALCPRCGMPSEGGLCKSCALETTKIFSCPDQVEVVICSVCGSQHVKGRWLQPDDRDEEEMAASAPQMPSGCTGIWPGRTSMST